MRNRGIGIGVLVIAWMAFLFSFVDRLSWSPILPVASKSLGMTATEAGSFMTAFYIGYVITQLPGGLLTDRFGYRKVLLGSFFVMGIFTALMGTVHSYEQGFAFRVLAGAGSGAVFSACVRAIFDWFTGKGRATAMGVFMTASSLGLTVVNLFVPTVAKDYGWRTSFYVSGVLPVVGLILAFFLLREFTSPAKQRQRGQSANRFWGDVLKMFSNRNLMIAGLAGFCAMWATWGTATWANTYMNKGLHLSLTEAGYFMSINGLAAIISKPVIGIVSDAVGGKRRMLLFWALIFFGPVLFLFGSNHSIGFLYFLAPLLGIVAFVYSPIMNTWIGELVDERLVGTATGFVNTIWQLGSMLSPLVVGKVIDATHNYFDAFLTLGIGPIVGALLVLFVKERSVKQTSTR